MRKVLLPSLLVLLLIAVAVAQAGGLIQISSDPYTNPSSQHQTQVEPDTYAFGNTIVAVFQTGRFTNGGASNIGWATSQDGGLTWTNGFVPSLTVYSTPAGPWDRASDPVIAYDAEHDVWMISALAMEGTSGKAVVVSRSTDGGLTWGAPVTVSEGGAGSFYDKNWTTCDTWPTSPGFGNCYTEWDDANQGSLLYMSTSTNGGLTWGPKKTTANNGTGLGGQPTARPDGIVIVPAANASRTNIIWFGSKNGGDSWSRTRNIASYTSHTPAGTLRTHNYLSSADVDASGKLYVVWADCRFRSGCSANDIVMSTSPNGANWAAPVRIPIDPTNSSVDHFIPGLVVDHATSGSTARLALTYYYYPNTNCSFSTCQLTVGFTSSMDGGTTWSAAQTIAGPMDMDWIADTTQGRMVGDYISTSFAGDNAVPVFSLALAPAGGLFQQHSFSTVIPVTAEEQYPLRVANDPILSPPQPAKILGNPLVTP